MQATIFGQGTEKLSQPWSEWKTSMRVWGGWGGEDGGRVKPSSWHASLWYHVCLLGCCPCFSTPDSLPCLIPAQNAIGLCTAPWDTVRGCWKRHQFVRSIMPTFHGRYTYCMAGAHCMTGAHCMAGACIHVWTKIHFLYCIYPCLPSWQKPKPKQCSIQFLALDGNKCRSLHMKCQLGSIS